MNDLEKAQIADKVAGSKNRENVFIAIYKGGAQKKHARFIARQLGISENRVTDAGLFLSRNDLVEQGKSDFEGQKLTHYIKNKNIAAHVPAIKRLITNTKRRRSILANHGTPTSITKTVTTKPSRKRTKTKKLKLLLISAAPLSESPLRNSKEFNSIQDTIKRSHDRDSIIVERLQSADGLAIAEKISEFRPNIVHFSGHGDSTGIAIDDGSLLGIAGTDLSYDQFANLLEATADNSLAGIVLSACESGHTLETFSNCCRFAIGMKTSLNITSGIVFSSGFYAALARKVSVVDAVKTAKLLVEINADCSPEDAEAISLMVFDNEIENSAVF